MAATTASSSPHFHKKPTTTLKFRRRRRLKETTISASATASAATTTTTIHHHPSVVSPENNSWCCPSAVSSHKPPPPPPPETAVHHRPTSDSPLPSPSPGSLSPNSPPIAGKIRSLSPGPILNLETPSTMSPNAATAAAEYGGASSPQETNPSSFSNFNSALTAGLLSPPSAAGEKIRSSPTLFEMMAKNPNQSNSNFPNSILKKPINDLVVIDKKSLIQQRVLDLLANRSPGGRFNDPNSSDLRLTLRVKDGFSVCLNVHREILVGQSRFFAVKLLENRRKRGEENGLMDENSGYIVEIDDCGEIEVYIESIRLMYCKDLRRKLMEEDVPRVLGILKVSAAIGFDAGVLTCLEYLEAAPWTEDEEEKVASLLSELHLERFGATEVLKRVSVDFTSGVNEVHDNEEVLIKLLHAVLDAKDEKARRYMKTLVSKMLLETSNSNLNSSQNDLRKESLYLACEKCLFPLRTHFLNASKGLSQDFVQITRQADNLHWLLDVLIDRQIAEDFLITWASQIELSEAHSKVPPLHRHEISRVTARLFVGVGKGQILTSKDSRFSLLRTWLVPFYDDFAWLRRGSRGLDWNLIEDGLCNTILTLPLTWQQEILLSWFDRFVNSGDDCPNLQRAFEVWWRRTFWRKKSGQPERSRHV